jgi:hypothetical protein
VLLPSDDVLRRDKLIERLGDSSEHILDQTFAQDQPQHVGETPESGVRIWYVQIGGHLQRPQSKTLLRLAKASPGSVQRASPEAPNVHPPEG